MAVRKPTALRDTMYWISTYEVADDPGRDGEWTPVASAPTLWALRPVIRELRSRGYDTVSVAIERR